MYTIMDGTEQQRNKVVNYVPVKGLCNDRSPLDTARNICVVFDGNFSFHCLFLQSIQQIIAKQYQLMQSVVNLNISIHSYTLLTKQTHLNAGIHKSV